MLLLILLFLLLLAAPAQAQKACTPTTTTTQACTVTLTWTAPAVDATHGAATSYVIRRADGGAAMAQIGTTTAAVLTSQNTFTDVGAIAHCWEVAGVNAGGTGPATPAVCWTSPAISVKPPNAPSGSTLAAISATELQASWRDNSDNEDQFKLVTISQTPPRTIISYAAAGATNFTIGGLQRNKTYCNKVSAMAGPFESMPDIEQCATTRK